MSQAVLAAPVFAHVDDYSRAAAPGRHTDVIAVIELINRLDGKPFSTAQEHLLTRFAEQLTHTLQQRQLELAVHEGRHVRRPVSV